jgi:signal transduction histidine kinase
VKKRLLTPRAAFVLFIVLASVVLAQAVWWIVFMARMVDEKVDIAVELGAASEYVEQIHDQEIQRQIMLGMEGIFFLVLILLGAWLIYRALVKAEELKFHQQNFLMAVTHELKTPLASMKIYLDSMKSDKIAAEKKTEIIPRMQADLLRLEKLVENILDAGRFERSGYHLSRHHLDLSQLVDKALNDLAARPSKVPVEIERSLKQCATISGDPVALRRAIDAILENSLRYNDQESVQLKVILSVDKNRCRLDISDNGIGLARKEAAQAFNRFYRAGRELSRSTPGSGLGLFLAREIIRAHDGDITVQSEGVGKGATFTITLKTEQDHETNSTG